MFMPHGFQMFPSTETDPHFANVALLIQPDGPDESTSFVDVTGKTITANGTAQHDTEFKIYSPSSVLLDGNSDWLSLAKNAGFEFGTGDFTLEAWSRLPSIAATQAIFYYGKVTASSNTDYAFTLLQAASAGGNGLVFTANNNAGAQVNTISNDDLTVDTFQFVQVVHESGVTKIRLGGTEIASQADTINHNTSASHVLLIGRRGSFSPSYLGGNLGPIRITKGVARPNVVPTGLFPTS